MRHWTDWGGFTARYQNHSKEMQCACGCKRLVWHNKNKDKMSVRVLYPSCRFQEFAFWKQKKYLPSRKLAWIAYLSQTNNRVMGKYWKNDYRSGYVVFTNRLGVAVHFWVYENWTFRVQFFTQENIVLSGRSLNLLLQKLHSHKQNSDSALPRVFRIPNARKSA